MITALDHVVLLCPEISGGLGVYEALLGRTADWQREEDGVASAQFRVDNTAIDLVAPTGDTDAAGRLREMITERGPGLVSLAFATDDIALAHHKLTRRGLHPGEISQSGANGRTWRRFRCEDAACAGIKTFILQHDRPEPGAAPPLQAGCVHSLDHLVISTPHPDRASAQYGARLGLDLALDRTAEQWDTRFLFFRTGGLTFEIVHKLSGGEDPAGPDRFFGLTWTVADLASAHARLTDLGFDLSEMRTGRKPGSSVFTVRAGTMNVPTLFISHAAR